MTTVHLVIPCYRESARIGGFLPELCAEMQRLGGVDVLVVEDGSGNEEQGLMRELIIGWSERFPCLSEPLMLSDNLGKGGAVYAGWSRAGAAEWLAFVDADGACPVHEVIRLVKLAKKQETAKKALFASRVKMLGKKVDRLLKRHLLGRIYATLVSEMLDVPVYDSQCGLKLVPAKAFAAVAESLRIHGFAFDVELMVALIDDGCAVEEVPIDWTEIPGGKVSLIRDSWRMARDVWGIRSRRRMGIA
ncbi:glycosyltransferase involved in cell wall biosynthesis [Prosthecobacter fusiformis]|uniref:Glycosyltransferase involved in cell wall biosynthesis n=1 Tax=Prosthecobacter fusiformis TaxID=48464 RepID=A0A4R7RLW0_9BACT|nr:glycosyltransferase [Prosthecobacter fusiformis]TDU64645.1 glycosyltransferase involved in cell wall biosynthesis [Prosthecobacter fusiformis]